MNPDKDPWVSLSGAVTTSRPALGTLSGRPCGCLSCGLRDASLSAHAPAHPVGGLSCRAGWHPQGTGSRGSGGRIKKQASQPGPTQRVGQLLLLVEDTEPPLACRCSLGLSPCLASGRQRPRETWKHSPSHQPRGPPPAQPSPRGHPGGPEAFRAWLPRRSSARCPWPRSATWTRPWLLRRMPLRTACGGRSVRGTGAASCTGVSPTPIPIPKAQGCFWEEGLATAQPVAPEGGLLWHITLPVKPGQDSRCSRSWPVSQTGAGGCLPGGPWRGHQAGSRRGFWGRAGGRGGRMGQLPSRLRAALDRWSPPAPPTLPSKVRPSHGGRPISQEPTAAPHTPPAKGTPSHLTDEDTEVRDRVGGRPPRGQVGGASLRPAPPPCPLPPP